MNLGRTEVRYLPYSCMAVTVVLMSGLANSWILGPVATGIRKEQTRQSSSLVSIGYPLICYDSPCADDLPLRTMAEEWKEERAIERAGILAGIAKRVRGRVKRYS